MQSPSWNRHPRRAALHATSSFAGQLVISDDDDDDGRDDKVVKPRSSRARGRGSGRGSGARGRGKGQRAASTRLDTPSVASTPRKRVFDVVDLSGDDTDEVTMLSPPSSFALTSVAGPSRTPSFVESPCNIAQLGPHVWVLTSPNGQLYDQDDAAEYLYWPAKNLRVENKHTLVLKPYGDLATLFRVKDPTDKTVLPLTNHGALRFTELTFLSSATPGSPRKRPRNDHADVADRWKMAVSLAVAEKMDEDEMPSIEFVISASNFQLRSPLARTLQLDDDGHPELLEAAWEDPGPDDAIDLGDERVLARVSASENSDHWPALVQDYTPSTSSKQRGKYHLLFFDRKIKAVPRNYFHALGDPNFATCKLGVFETVAVKAPPDPQDRWVEQAVPTADNFFSLPIRHQFAHTVHIMEAILRKEYAPAQKSMDMFMRGGAQRKALTEAASLRGKISPDDVESINGWVIEWALRDEGRPQRIDGDVQILVDEQPNGPVAPSSPLTVMSGDAIATKLDELASIALSVPLPDTDAHEIILVASNTVENIPMDLIPVKDAALPEPVLTDIELPLDEGPLSDNTNADESIVIETHDEDIPMDSVPVKDTSLVTAAVSESLSTLEPPSHSEDLTLLPLHEEVLKAEEIVNVLVADSSALEDNSIPSPSEVVITASNIEAGLEEVSEQAISIVDVVTSTSPSIAASAVSEYDAEVVPSAVPSLVLENDGSISSTVVEIVVREISQHDLSEKKGVKIEVDSETKLEDTDEIDLTQDSPPIASCSSRPIGCEEYESLSRLAKLEFCQNVLLPEAIKQVLLWRNGERSSRELLSAQEEHALSNRGEELLQETDWVFDLKHVREALDRNRNSNLRELKKVLVGGTRSRPKYA